MPFTFLSHQAPVLPFKRLWPRMDGVALVAGSAMPDFAFAFSRHVNVPSHEGAMFFLWNLPLGVAAAYALRHAFLPVYAPLSPLRAFRGFAHVSRRRPSVLNMGISAIFGAFNHVMVDHFTHENALGPRWFPRAYALPVPEPFRDLAQLLQVVLTVAFAPIALVLFAKIGRKKIDEYGDLVPLSSADRRARWAVLGAAVFLGALAAIPTPGSGFATPVLRGATTFFAVAILFGGAFRQRST